MHCRAFESRLQKLLDERLGPEFDDALQQHAAECQSCSELLDGQRLLFDGMDSMSIPLLEKSMSSRLSEELEQLAHASRSSSVSPFRSRRWLAAAIAASLLVGLWLVLPGSQEQGTPGDGAHVVSKLIPEAGAGIVLNRPSDDHLASIKEVTLPYPVAEFLVQKVDNPGISDSLLRVSPPAHLVGLPFSHAPLRRQVGDWMRDQTDINLPVDRIRKDLRPLSAPLTTILDALRQSFAISSRQGMG